MSFESPFVEVDYLPAALDLKFDNAVYENTVYTRFTAWSWLRARLNSRPCEQNIKITKGPCLNTRPM